MKTNNSNGQMTAQVSLGNQQKSGFDLSNNVLGTGKLGRIYPTRALHVMPNDSLNNKTQVAVQFEPLAVPILANMFVKQEHFYCPYNIVWKNWDKFISGGEKLDYKGVVPNVTMTRICSVVSKFLFVEGNALELGAKEVSTEYNNASGYYELAFSVTNDGYFESLKNQLDTIGAAFGIDDILDEQREALKALVDFYDKIKRIYTPVGNHLFIQYNTDSGSFGNFEELWEEYSKDTNIAGSKYMISLKQWAREFSGANGYVILPTSNGLTFLQLMYDYFKSFIGVGSNIDYLNMARVTFTDYLYVWLSQIAKIDLEGTGNRLYYNSGLGFEMSENPLSILHLRANYSVWYNNYRDILLETIPLEPVDGDTITDEELFTLLVPRQRCWEKDAFTTALDNPGTGNVGVPLSLSSAGYYGETNRYMDISKINNIGKTTEAMEPYIIDKDNSNIAEITIGEDSYRIPTAYLSGVNGLVNLPTMSGEEVSTLGFSLYALDAAQRAQKWLQKALFFGNRISDFYYMRFGVRYLDARLRLPELLTSSSELVRLDVVMNNTNITTEANGQVYQSVAGDRAAYASSFDNGNGYNRFCEEHGVVLSYLTVMPDPTYAFGQSRDYSRLDQFDFAFNEFATLGMDAVYDTEITAVPFKRGTKVFGYQGKYYDYKAKHSEEHGELLESQDMYTFGRRFDMYSEEGAPKLNYAFVHCFPPLDMFVVDSKLADYFRFDMRHNTTCERLLPAQSIYI